MAVKTSWSSGDVLTAADLTDTFAAKLDASSQKVIQIVRATDGSARSTTSTSYVDVTGMSVTITPVNADSNIIVITSCFVDSVSATGRVQVAISDSSNNLLSGAERGQISQAGAQTTLTVIGWHTPGTTSATTYKTRFLVDGGTGTIRNNLNTGQMYAIEVSA